MKKAFLILFSTIFSSLSFAQTIGELLAKDDTIAAMALIKSGADINAVDKMGNTLLLTECRWGKLDRVSFLLRNGATVDKPRSPKGRTPLMVASAYYSGKTICSMLIANGADVNATAQDGSTALMLAAQSAKLDVVELLLKKGAIPMAKDAKGRTALEYAKSATELEYIKNSVKDCRIDQEATMKMLAEAMK